MNGKTAWKDYDGVLVFLEDDGDFYAEVNGVHLRQACWEHLRKKIDDEKKADLKAVKVSLPCVVLVCDSEDGTGDYGIERLTIVGLNRRDSTYKWADGMQCTRAQRVVPDTPENLGLMEQLAVAKSTVRDIENALSPRSIEYARYGGRIEVSKYNESLKQLQFVYDRAAAVGRREPVAQ